MNEKIKKTFRAMTSAALAGAFVVSSVIGGGADSFVSSSVVFAEETDSTSSVAERTAAAKERYLSKLAEAKALSADDYSADSFATYNVKLSDYDVTNILDMYSNPYTSYEYEKLIQGIECAKQFLISDKSHTYYNDLKNLISYGENINSSDYTEESYSAFKTQFDTLLSGNYSLENAYSLEEAGNGADIYHYYISQRYATCFNLLVSKNRQDINITDELTGVSLVSNTDVISSNVIFSVDKFNHDNWNWTEVDLPGLIDTPNMCSNYEYYSFNITDADNNRKNITAPYTVEIPVNNEFDIDNLSITIYKNNASKGSIVTRKIDKENRKIILTFKQNFLNYANGAAIMIANPIKAIDPTTLEDGIYSIDAELTMYSDASKASMANSALNHDAFLVKSGDSIDTYMNFNPIYVFDVNTPAFCGGLWSEKGVHDDGEYYSDSETILSCYTNEDGSIRNNDIYNGVTEIPCIKAIKLHLERECYNQYGGYTLAVSSPTMAAMSNTPFEEMKMDTLTCNLMISKPLYLGTIEEASSYLPLYDKSALLRKIKQAEIINNIGANTVNVGTAFADAYTVYNKADATSQEIEAAIDALDATATGKIPSAKVTGYSLTAKEDFGLHLFVDLGYDAQNDANAAVKFNIGGTEKTIAVSDATFVEGKGYEFVLDVPAKKMYDEITAEIVLSDGAEIIGDANLGTYSVAGYLNDYIASDDNTLDALAQATLTYGAYADKFFNGSTDAELADVSAVTIDDVAQYKHNINVAEEGIEFIGAALTLESKTSIKLYFKVDEDNLYDISEYAFTVNGKEAQPTMNGDYYYITVPTLPAGELANAQTFTVKYTTTDTMSEYSYSPFSYVYAALADSDAEKEADLINLVKALYLYGVEAGKVA